MKYLLIFNNDSIRFNKHNEPPDHGPVNHV